jgi:hypothetical protein
MPNPRSTVDSTLRAVLRRRARGRSPTRPRICSREHIGDPGLNIAFASGGSASPRSPSCSDEARIRGKPRGRKASQPGKIRGRNRRFRSDERRSGACGGGAVSWQHSAISRFLFILAENNAILFLVFKLWMSKPSIPVQLDWGHGRGKLLDKAERANQATLWRELTPRCAKKVERVGADWISMSPGKPHRLQSRWLQES